MAKILILGSSGLVGGYLLQKVLEDDFFEQVTIWVRRPPAVSHSKLSVLVTDFKEVPEIQVDIVYSCLGTTRKKTPDLLEYEFIEVGIPVSTARTLLAKGLQQFHYISSIGAGQKSRGFYLKLKTKAESKLSSMQLPALLIYRPSLIFGQRKEKRTLEGFSNIMMKILQPLFIGGYKKYRRIDAETIALAMIAATKENLSGEHIFESDQIQDLSYST